MIHTYVLGLGNVLMGDDGFGPAAVRAFAERYDVGPGVEVIDLGTPGLDLTPWFTDARHIVIVDTVQQAGLSAGSLRVYDKADLTRHAPFSRVSPHDPGVKETVLTLEFAGRAPAQITVVGVVPSHVAMGLTLTPVVAAAVPGAVEAIAEALAGSGSLVRLRKPNPHVATPWWQPPVVAHAACREPGNRSAG